MEMKFYQCKHCGQIIEVVKNAGVPVMCCGEKMSKLIPNVSDGAGEKHMPVYEIKENKVIVAVGSVAHPMLEAHYIEWVAIETKFGVQRKELKPEQEPKVCFSLCDGDQLIAVYAYCNLHGLWKAIHS